MPNIAQVLKEEISRLARKEVRAACDPLRKQVRSLRDKVKQQQSVVARLEKDLSKAAAQSSDTRASLYAPKEKETKTRARATPASIRRHRHRLGLSQADLGKLLGVSTNTVVRWEAGSSRPRAQHRGALLKLREVGVRDLKQMMSG